MLHDKHQPSKKKKKRKTEENILLCSSDKSAAVILTLDHWEQRRKEKRKKNPNREAVGEDCGRVKCDHRGLLFLSHFKITVSIAFN